jgi:hypothetical protein
MKKLIGILFMLYAGTAFSQQSYQDVLYKGDSYQVHLNRVVVMDDATFGMYHYYKAQYDSLSQLIKVYDREILAIDSLNTARETELKALVKVKQETLEAAQQAYQEMKTALELSIGQTQDCRLGSLQLEREVERQKRLKGKFAVSSIVLTLVAIVAIAL